MSHTFSPAKQYLAIDIGNVICHVNFEKFLDKLSRELSMSKTAGYAIVEKIQKHQDLGLTTVRETFAGPYSDDLINEIVEYWNETVVGEPLIINRLLKLIDNGVEVAFLSNIGREHAALMQNVLTPALYDKCVKFFSCEVGARKPTHLYYKTFLDLYPSYVGCVYVDDRQENIDSGTKFGFESCTFAIDSFKNQKDMLEMWDAIEILINNKTFDI